MILRSVESQYAIFSISSEVDVCGDSIAVSMILKLSRARRNDTALTSKDAVSQARRKYCGPHAPRIFSKANVSSDPTGEEIQCEIELPPIHTRQGWNAQDPLGGCYHYLYFMHVILPALFGLRMCFHCPDCQTAVRRSSDHSLVVVGRPLDGRQTAGWPLDGHQTFV